MSEADHARPGDSQGPGDDRSRASLILYGLATLLALVTYAYGLGSEHIPKNGDEYLYEHITRLTADSGHWLPLQSALPQTRNTKPPLLFWQGIASTNWGREWTLWRLRLPSVIYTALTAALVFVLGRTLSGRTGTGFLATLIFAAFLSTYRYGRPFLTDAPSVFWLFVPIAAVLIRPTAWDSRAKMTWLSWLLGLATAVGLLYKSFALVIPVALCLSWWSLRRRQYQIRTFVKRDAAGILVLSVVALALFSLWFVLDPDPGAIVREFVLKENVGKFGAPSGYLRNFFWGASSVWRLLVAYPIDAGVLMFPLVASARVAFRHRAQLANGERLLWMWAITLLVVFCLPSQRDERYLLPAMPALAVVCSLHWAQIRAWAFRATLIVTGVGALLLAYLALRLDAGAGGTLYPAAYWLPVIATGLLVAASLAVPRIAPSTVTVAVLFAYLSFATFVRPLDGPAGTYSAEAIRATSGQTVWVPTDFGAKEEGHRFLLPGADVRGYPYDRQLTAADLAARYPFFAITQPMNAPAPANATVLGERLDIGSRLSAAQIADILRGDVFEHLFVRERLVKSERREPSPPGAH